MKCNKGLYCIHHSIEDLSCSIFDTKIVGGVAWGGPEIRRSGVSEPAMVLWLSVANPSSSQARCWRVTGVLFLILVDIVDVLKYMCCI